MSTYQQDENISLLLGIESEGIDKVESTGWAFPLIKERACLLWNRWLSRNNTGFWLMMTWSFIAWLFMGSIDSILWSLQWEWGGCGWRRLGLGLWFRKEEWYWNWSSVCLAIAMMHFGNFGPNGHRDCHSNRSPKMNPLIASILITRWNLSSLPPQCT